MNAPAELAALTGDGKRQVIAQAGASLPCETRLVFATSEAGQAELSLELAEASTLVARARFELPRGLPANTWIPVFVCVGEDLRVQAEARENLRRIRIEASFEVVSALEHYRLG